MASRAAQYEAFKVVNRELVALYWDIGTIIVRRQQEQNWGKSVVEQLAADLQEEFPGITGFSARNIWYMRRFYLTYHESPKLQPLVAEISWSNNMIILDKCKDDQQREFYIRMTGKFGWTKDVYAQLVKMPRRTLQRDLQGLVKNGLLVKYGTGKTTRYERSK